MGALRAVTLEGLLVLKRTRGLLRLARAGATWPGDIPLENGARIGVIGGGPAGSLFSTFALRLAETCGLHLEVDVYEARDFRHRGPAGCNHCGGIVSESLVQMLAIEGLPLPPSVVQRGIDSYVLHMDVGTVRIGTPLAEKRIAAVFRGNGPRESELDTGRSFDRHLLELAVERGARVHCRLVTGLRREDGKPVVVTSDGASEMYDLLVVASGINGGLLGLLPGLGLRVKPPKAVKTFITELRLGRERIARSLGTSMHVFLLDLPRLEFAALIPKGDFVTCCLLGDDIDDELVRGFLGSREVLACFPGAELPDTCCHCFPRLNVSPTWPPYGDRVVLVGDAGVTRLYKDGIGAAYRTAKAAATTSVLQGVSAGAFQRHYEPACRRLTRDNAIGRLLFTGSHLLQRSRFARGGILRMTRTEQASPTRAKRLSGMLWDLFTGSAPYREVLARGLHPAFGAGLLWHLAGGGRENKS